MLYKRILAGLLSALTAASILSGCQSVPQTTDGAAAATLAVTQQSVVQSTAAPKYVFLFIGDGMSYPQFQAASDYLGAIADPDPAILKGGKALSFMNFPVAGTATTFDSTSFAPDSASTATSLATGYKTHSGVVNMDETKTRTYEAITEKLKAQKGYKIGVVSSVNLNHATPAAFYAHQPTRGNYYAIGQELVESGFDYFAGGALIDPTGKEKNQTDIYAVARQGGYKVVTTQAEAKKLTQADGKAIVIGETLADSNSLSYTNDSAKNEWVLKDYVSKGIELLDNEKGFFMMVEGGKIDWACHANDAGSTVADTVALGDAVSVAVDFYKKHPAETLILVTGDHETGGLTIGFAGTNYDIYLQNLQNQKISYAKFDSDYVANYVAKKTPFQQVLRDIKTNFGLMTKDDPAAKKDSGLVLSDYELQRLRTAYDLTMKGGLGKDPSQQDYVLYGTYEPLSVTITHILNNKSGINFSSYSHTGLPVAVFAQGLGADNFKGYYDNTDIYSKLATMLGVK